MILSFFINETNGRALEEQDDDKMNFFTYNDLHTTILRNLSLIPADVDLIVGIPRSGMLVASILAIYMNLPMGSIDEFYSGEFMSAGLTKPKNGWIKNITEARRILVVDDSVAYGRSMKLVKEKISMHSELKSKCIYMAVYVTKKSRKYVDIFFEIRELPRLFQWNFLQKSDLENMCFDIDGVLCDDPKYEENDDGERYLDFIRGAKPKLRPQYKIGYLVTSRLEKYRKETESWLKNNGIAYRKLVMLDNMTAEERKKLGIHAAFKAKFYASRIDAELFVESNPVQAKKIFGLTGKPVFCVDNQAYYSKEGSQKCSVQRLDKLTLYIVRRILRTSVPVKRFLTQELLDTKLVYSVWGYGVYGNLLIQLLDETGTSIKCIYDERADELQRNTLIPVLYPNFRDAQQGNEIIIVAASRNLRNRMMQVLADQNMVEGTHYISIDSLFSRAAKRYVRYFKNCCHIRAVGRGFS